MTHPRVFAIGDNAQGVYGGRGTMLGNPFRITRHTGRMEAIAMFKSYFLQRIETDEEFKAYVKKLAKRNLICHCAPLPCHLEVVAKWQDENV